VTRRAESPSPRRTAFVVVAALSLLLGGVGRAQDVERDPKAVALVEAAIAELGGERYLAIKAISSKGVFTPFVKGSRGLPLEFVDIFVFPSSERTDFGKKRSLIVQANVDGRGWKYDASREVLEDQSEDELRGFRDSSRSNLESLLPSIVRDKRVSVTSLGRTEVAPRQRVDGVEASFPDGFSVELYFEPTTKEPSFLRYTEGGAGSGGARVEIRFHTFVAHEGVKSARIIDFYRDGVQTGRSVTDQVTVNPTVSPTIFVKRSSIKDLK